MAKNLFIIFTKKDGAPVELRHLLGDSFLTEKIIGIDEHTVKRGVEQMHSELNPDVLIVWDSFDLEQVEGLLESKIKPKSNVYVIFHKSLEDSAPHILENQQKTLRKICTDNKKSLFETSEHHNKGNYGADRLNIIAGMINNNSFERNVYNKVLDEILKNPHYIGPKLEAKLELLHACLTPEGAKNIFNNGFPKTLEKEKEKFWNKKLDELNPSLFKNGNNDTKKYKDWTVREVVKALSGDNTTDKKINLTDPFDSDYLSTLSLLRDALINYAEQLNFG